ncbi:hypothetical protein BO70DRAFT_322630 [Aspergillus heteromorphus CBS 117.55]|uniref:Uncharacterized protein n=1 Tax=Aspergillus heteromorphus CBS 117.55 TaxID=1448321 RepID=A0A317V5F3_9EURO|nr:uncharacterized protein BO70DRAFT_322630 [Aspergillus heteromorphus CBS 117.55]PWY69534.1 hypothetical protein BO70DRAFT_322630 [Aspergillus heteromorphus CBS 117.55]
MPGPPQPEWRRTTTTHPQHPPQPSWQASSPPPPPRPPRPPSAPLYDPNLYGQISTPPPAANVSANVSPSPGLAAADTTAWGVKYNRHQLLAQTPPPPPLPPRPSSTTHSPQAQSPIVSPLDPSFATQPAPDASYQQWPQNALYAPQQPVTYLPPQAPPPLPVPSGYQDASLQQSSSWQQSPPPYSSVPLTQYHGAPAQQAATLSNPNVAGYPTPSSGIPQAPSPQQAIPVPYQEQQRLPHPPQVSVAPAAGSEDGSFPTVAPPVPPKTNPSFAPTNASALGFGGPSDWEYLSSSPGIIDDMEAFGAKRQDSPPLNPSAGISPDHPVTAVGPTASGPCISPVSPPTETPVIQTAHADEQIQRGGPISSPSTALNDRNPPPPIKVQSESAHSPVSIDESSESIDGIIDAWNRPIPADSEAGQAYQGSTPHPEVPSPSQKLSPIDIPKQESTLPRKQVQSKPRSAGPDSATSEATTEKRAILPAFVPLDPYDDLDPWSKSSLERYVAMLRKEAVADSDKERFGIFTAFMAKETKLREILYSVESSPTPVDEAIQDVQPTPSPQESTYSSDINAPPVESGLIPVESEDDYFASTSIHDGPEDGSYSPGGRPVLPRLHTPGAVDIKRSASHKMGHRHDTGHAAASSSRSSSVPPSMMNDVERQPDLPPLTTNPPQPIYIPFRYAEGPQRGSDELVFDRPAYQAYSDLRQASAESGRVMSNAPTSTSHNLSTSVMNLNHNKPDETFIGLIREKSVAYRKKAPRRTSSPPPLPASLRQGKPTGPVEDLRAMVSSPAARHSESQWHVTTRKELEIFTGDFTYIREAGKSWELSSKSRKEELDKERVRRQEKSENRVDTLFNGKEIGYADINVLEEEFRQKEARAQLEEERQELDNFIANVFEPLDRRLKEEVSTLQTHYESALTQLDHDNSKIKSATTDKYNLSDTMKLVNEIYRKLEMRYQKRLEIALDRERRRKKAERRPLVFMGDSLALKQVDKDFDQMERRNILEAARERDERANRLMDSFDDAIMHGLGENQSLLDEVAAKVAKIDAANSSSALPDSEAEPLLKSVYNLVESLRRDSESILHSFGVADSVLNDADYSVSVAEARYSEADPDVFRRLDDEKKKEDDKIQTDLKSKLDSVRNGPAKITASINGILESLGKSPIAITEEPDSTTETPSRLPVDVLSPTTQPPAASSPSRKPGEDPEHHQRLRKALDDAKKRNAARKNA